MKKVDYASYWMGYELMKNISANVLPEVKATLPENYAFEINGRRYSRPFYPEPLAPGECVEDICNHSAYPDYWLGAIIACNNNSLPFKADLNSEFISYFYKFDELTGDYLLDVLKISKVGLDLYQSMDLFLHISEMHQALITKMVPVIPHKLSPEQYFKSSGVIEYVTSLAGAKNPPDLNPALRQAICLLSRQPSICETIKNWYNVKSYDCTISDDIIQSAAALEKFTDVTPNIVFSNGLKLYVAKNYILLKELSDAEDENDRTGYLIYIDVNGDSGKGKLWEDVFPFYLLESGKIIPAYKEDPPSGGNNRDHLSVNVIYDVYSENTREVKLLMSDANFRSAACATGYIKSAKYCGDKVQYDICKDVTHDCRMIVKEPIKIF